MTRRLAALAAPVVIAVMVTLRHLAQPSISSPSRNPKQRAAGDGGESTAGDASCYVPAVDSLARHGDDASAVEDDSFYIPAVDSLARHPEWFGEVFVPSLHDRLVRYLDTRQHTLSTWALMAGAAFHAQARYVRGEARELVDAVDLLVARIETGQFAAEELLAVQREIADVVLSATTMRTLLARHGLPTPEVELLIEEKTNADAGRG